MTLARQMVLGQKTKSDLMDDGFNRHAFNDKDGLPSWFLDDEMRHFRTNVPITKEAVQAIREKQRALNARPIKKIAEVRRLFFPCTAVYLERLLTVAPHRL